MPIDDEFDDVTVFINTKSIRDFASWDPITETLFLDVPGGLKTNLYKAKVTLYDGNLTTDYILFIIVWE